MRCLHFCEILSNILDFSLAEESFFHTDFDVTLKNVYGDAVNPESLVVEGGVVE